MRCPDGSPDAGAVWHYGDPFGEQHAAERSAVVVDRSHRVVIALNGPDRRGWLHSISTQHVADLGDGACTENLSLDGQGRVEDHWQQTECGETAYLDTEPWRGPALLSYLEKMVFWSDVRPARADLAVLSLLGPDLGAAPVLTALGLDALPSDATAVALNGRGAEAGSDAGSNGGFVRRMPASDGQIELDLLVPTEHKDRWLARLAEAGVRPAGVWAYEAHRVAEQRPRLGVDTDERTIPHEVGWIGRAVHLDKGCYRGQETVARVHNLGRPPRMLVLLHLDGSGERPATGDPVLADGRQVGRIGTVVDHADLGPIALALLKRGIPAGTPLRTGGEHPVAAEIDVESLPPADVAGAGRVAVDRLRHGH